MKFMITSAEIYNNESSSDIKVLKEYPVLKKYKPEVYTKEIKHTAYKYGPKEDYVELIKSVYIEINTLEELQNLINDIGEDIIIKDNNSIIIYDDYIE